MTQQQLTPEQQAEVDKQVAARLAAAMAGSNGNGHASGSGQAQNPMAGWGQQQAWGQQAPAQPGMMAGVPAAEKVFIPIELVGPDGSKVSCYLQFPGNFAEPTALMGLIGQLMSMGVPVRAFAPRQQGWGSRGGYNGNGGGGYRNGGGYNGNGGGGYGGRRW